MMKHKGQGALEYLLLIGGALIVVAVVLVFLFDVMGSGGKIVTKAMSANEILVKGGIPIKFTVNGLDASGDCGSDGVIEVYARIDGTDWGPISGGFVGVPNGSDWKEYEILIPKEEYSGSVPFEVRFEDCWNNPNPSDDNLRIKEVIISGTDYATVAWEAYYKNPSTAPSPTWHSWTNDGTSEIGCHWNDCVKATITFD